MVEKMRYFIWSIEHRAWWSTNGSGYTTQTATAGIYTEEEAIGICNRANIVSLNEAMIPVSSFGHDNAEITPAERQNWGLK